MTAQDILYLADTGEKMEYNGTVHQLFLGLKPTIYLGGKYYTVFSLCLEYPGN
jgi:hypothetical protein